MPVTSHEMEILSRRLTRAHHTAIHSQLQAAGLGEVGHPMLLSILENSQSSDGTCCHAQRELADLLHISPAAVANSLKSLEKGGYIHREPHAEDARRNLVILTDKGAAAVRDCHCIFDRVGDQMMEGFSEEEKLQLMSFRRRMLHNLSKHIPGKEEL